MIFSLITVLIPVVSARYSFKSTTLNSDQESQSLVANYFGNTPLCIDDKYNACLDKSQASFQICSIDNKACQCYNAAASLVECSRHCDTYNLNSFVKFKTLCDTNPYILQWDDELYHTFNNKIKKPQYLIKELENYKEARYSNDTIIDNELTNAIFELNKVEPKKSIFDKNEAENVDESQIFEQRSKPKANSFVQFNNTYQGHNNSWNAGGKFKDGTIQNEIINGSRGKVECCWITGIFMPLILLAFSF